MKEKKLYIEIKEGSDYRGVGGLVKRLVHPSTTGSKNVSTSIAYVNPGEELPFHSHNNEEIYFVLEGGGLMKIEGYKEEIKLEKYLSVYIPDGRKHYTINNGNEPLILLCSLSPPPQIKK